MSGWEKDDETAVFSVDRTATAEASVARRDRALLTVLSGTSTGTIVRLDHAPFAIGRSADCDLVLEDDGISRRHAELRLAGNDWQIADLGSKNGTFVGGQEVRERALRHGDRVQLGRSTLLQFSLADELEEQLQQSLVENATRDALTGLFNRRHFDERLLAEYSFSVRHGALLGIVLLDVDWFREVNNRHGHLAGDAVLRVLGAAIRRIIRAEDFAARYGGEEFVVITRNIDSKNLALFAERLRRAIERMVIPWNGTPIPVTVSLGTATMEGQRPFASPAALLQAADTCLYRAKELGRNRVVSA